MDIVVTGLLLSGVYALVAIGLNLQYGVARIMNLANGELLVAGALAAFWFYTGQQVSPLVTALVAVPVAFCVNWIIYTELMRPLVRRAKSQGQLDSDAILATFGLAFALVGIMVSIHGEYFSYSWLANPVTVLGATVGENRAVAFLCAVGASAALILWLYATRSGMAVRAVSVSPEASGLVGINVARVSAFAFALGGAVTVAGGVLISSFITLDASIGVIFTMKALIIVIMGGVGDVRGTVIAALILGMVETAVARLIDPGLTLVAAYAIFLLVLLFRPQGLFGRRSA